MYFQYILLTLIVVAESTEFRDYMKLEYIKPGDTIIFESPNYPNYTETVYRSTLDVINLNPGTLTIKCNIISFRNTEDCSDGYFAIIKRDTEEKWCDYIESFEEISDQQVTRITFFNIDSYGLCRCQIYLTPNENKDQTMNAELEVIEEPSEVFPISESYQLKEYHANLIPGEIPNTFLELLPIPPNTDFYWTFTTVEGYRISIYCEEHSFAPCNYIGGNLEIYDGERKEIVCGFSKNRHVFTSTSNMLNIQYRSYGKLHHDQLRTQCIVQPVSGDNAMEYKNIVSEEVDSSEHGVGPGPRTTSCDCGMSRAKSRARIVNGEDVVPGEYPWMVALVQNPSNVHFCGGSIISNKHILTATHCMIYPKPEHYKILAGTVNISKDAPHQEYYVKEIIRHPEFNGGLLNIHDLTIMVLKDPIQYTNRIGPICLIKERPSINGKYITTMGWGAHGNSKIKKPQELLLKRHQRVVDTKSCSYHWYTFFEEPHMSRFCIYSKSGEVCSGDSGGPVVWVDPDTNRYSQVSLVSMGRACISLFPAIGPHLADYYDWIKETVKATAPNSDICSKV